MAEACYSAALDSGGTKILAGIFPEGHLLARKRIKTRAAGRILETVGNYPGLGLAALATMFDPQAIILGGGVIQPNGLLLQHARNVFETRVIQPPGRLVRILPAELGDESSLWGTAMLVAHTSGRQVSNV